jgi:hypothetical protein
MKNRKNMVYRINHTRLKEIYFRVDLMYFELRIL